MGFYISFSGIVTFRNAEQLRDAARYVPLDRLLVETDSPYLAPVPHRGKENQPALVRDVAEYMAVLKGCRLSIWLSRPPTILPPCSTSTPPVCNLLDLLIILRLVINSQSE